MRGYAVNTYITAECMDGWIGGGSNYMQSTTGGFSINCYTR